MFGKFEGMFGGAKKVESIQTAEDIASKVEVEKEAAELAAELEKEELVLKNVMDKTTEFKKQDVKKVDEDLLIGLAIEAEEKELEDKANHKSDPVYGGSHQIDADQPKHKPVDHSSK